MECEWLYVFPDAVIARDDPPAAQLRRNLMKPTRIHIILLKKGSEVALHLPIIMALKQINFE
jgi:hypothetical protein